MFLLSRHISSIGKIVWALAVMSCWLQAAPYGPNGIETEWTQPDGSKVTLRVIGDEFYARTETLDGYTVVFDPATKTYHYATLTPDGNEYASTGKQVGKVDPRTLGLAKKLDINPASKAAKARKNYQAHEAIVKQEARWAAVKASSRNYEELKKEVKKQEKASKTAIVIPTGTIFPDSEIPAPAMTSGERQATDDPPIAPAPPSFTLSGTVVGLTILVDFSDVPGTVITQPQMDDHFNKPNYTGFSNAGSVYDYFLAQSGGKLRYNNNVTYYVRLPQPKSYYDDTTKSSGTCGRLLLNDALDILIANGYDFSGLTTKSGGYVRACNVLFAGADSGVWSKGLWPHRSSISARSVGNGTYIYDYQITEIGTTPKLTIGTICHENGHMLLGYPDLYSYDGNAGGVGYFSLMDVGSYAGNPAGCHPANIDSYLKSASGWMDVIDLSSSSQQRCTVQVDGNQIYRYRNPAKPAEYFVFEVRDDTGYEGPLGGQTGSANPSAGLVAYHVNETGSNGNSSIFTADNPACSYTKPYELIVIEANPTTAMTPWYDKPVPDSTDAFKSSGQNQLSDTTHPALKFWDLTGRNTASGCNINSISADGPTMTFVAGTAALATTPGIALSRAKIESSSNYGATATAQTFTICNSQGGTLNYTVTDDQPWLSCTPASGTATSESDNITVSFSSSGLAAGTYSATITVTDPAASPTTATILVSLTVNAQPVLALSKASIIANGLSETSGPQASFTISNVGGGSTSYTLSSTQPWLSLSSTSGTLVTETDTIYVNLDATSLADGTYNDVITITAPSASNSPLTIPVTFQVDGSDMILSAPNGGEKWAPGTEETISWSSSIGGNVKIELLKNQVVNRIISASTANDGSYIWLIPAGQTLGSNYRVRITSIESPATGDQSFADFAIAPIIYFASMDTNPGWTLQGAWAWGQPTGVSGDPTSGYTGNNVIGYNLNGTYTNSLAETHATTPAINCSGRTNVQLSFYRWLGIESGNYDKAYIKVSNNGTNWTTIFAHNTSSSATIQESTWKRYTYDISAIADNKSTVYVRWTMGTTDSSTVYAGWNIDDVTIESVLSGGPEVVITPSGGTTAVTEGGATDTYLVRLATQPTANVTINITPDPQAEVSPTSLTFTTANWNAGQTVTVNAINDALNEFAHTATISHTATSTDNSYNHISIDGLLVQITDNDNLPPLVSAGIDQTITLSGVIWNPTDVGPLVWYDATDSTTITHSSGAVSQWADKVGTSHMVQAASGKRPMTGTGTISGANVISFDGADDALKTSSNPFGGSVSNAMVMGVFNIGTITGSTLFSLTGSSTNTNRWQSHAPWSDGNLYFDCGNTGGANRVSKSHGWLEGQDKLLGYYCSLTDSVQQVWVNGSSFVSDNTGHTVNTNSGIALGHDGSGSYDNCRIGEVLIINSTVSAADREKIEGYLANKWNLTDSLPAEHPYKTQAPSSASAVAMLDGAVSDPDGNFLTARWTVVSGPGMVTFSNESAAETTATFSIPGTYTLRLTATDPAASTSDDVVITINPSADFSVTYAGNNHTGGTPPTTQAKMPGGNLTVASNSGSLVKTGYSFAGWNTAANGNGINYASGSTYSTDSNLALYAQWTPDTYPVTYSSNGATSGTAPVAQIKTHGISLTLATNSGSLAKTSYAFSGWNTAADGTGTTYAAGAVYSGNAPLTLYAKWEPMTYTVSYHANGSTSGTIPASQTKGYDVSLTLATNSGNLAKTGYSFAGWNTSANGTGTNYAAGGTYSINAAVTLYAKWTPNTYAVNYDANNATSGTPPANQNKTHDVTLTLATNSGSLARAGYTFTGWNTAANGSGTDYAAGATYTANAAITLYAKWTVNTYLVSYNANGATSGVVPASHSKTHGIDLALATNSGNLAKTNHNFTGWNTAANGSGTHYEAGGTYITDSAVTLYAEWMSLGALNVTPTGGFTSTGSFGGAFSPSSQTYTLTNSGAVPLSWTASNIATWITVSPTSGTLAPGANTTVIVSINSGADTLNVGTHGDTVTFTNTSTGAGTTTRSISLTIGKASQTISFGALSAVSDTTEPFALTATASSGLPVSFASSNSLVATVSGNVITIVGVGSTTITASQAGNASYNAAAAVPQLLTVNRTNPLAAAGGPYTVLLNQSLSLNGSASLPSGSASITSYSWDLNRDNVFGDVTGPNPAAISYAALTGTWGMIQGNNTIYLQVTDSDGKTATASSNVIMTPALTWDANATTTGQTNGSGAWLDANLWWDGSANTGWASGSDAIIGGQNTAGGTITLASPTSVGSITFNRFTGTYTLGTADQTITLSSGITSNSTAGAVSIIGPVTLSAAQSWANHTAGGDLSFVATGAVGNGGNLLTLTGTGTFNFTGNGTPGISGSGGLTVDGARLIQAYSMRNSPAMTYTGTTTLQNGGSLIHNGNLGSGNLTINGGYIESYSGTSMTRSLGPNAGQIQISGGVSGFSEQGGSSTVTLNNSATSEVVWGAANEAGNANATGFFNPSTLLLQANTANSGKSITLANKVDLNGATRAIRVDKNSATYATISGVIRTSSGTAGLTKEGPGTLILSANNTYNGTTTVNSGILDFAAGTLGFGGGAGRNISVAPGAAVRRNALTNAFLNRLVETTHEITVMTGATSNNLDFASSIGANLPNAFLGNWASNGGKTEYSGTLTPASDAYRLGGTGSSGLFGIVGTDRLTGTQGLIVGGTGASGIRLMLAGSNNFTGDTVINSGARLTLGHNLAMQNSALNVGSAGGNFALNSAGTITGAAAATSPTFGGLKGSRDLLLVFTNAAANNESNLAATAVTGFTLNPGEGKSHTYSGGIADFATGTTITKTGLGTQVLAGSNTYTGSTTVSAGKLRIDGSLSSVNAALTVANNATLGGIGTIGRDVAIADGGKLEFDISTPAANHDPFNLAAGKSITFAGATTLTINSNSGAAPGTYTLITGGNNIAGVAPATLNLPANWSATVSISGNSLLLNVTSIGTPPSLASITDNKSGGPVAIHTLVTFTVTFTKDMDSGTVTAADFGNAGTAPITIGAISETSPGIFTVQATPTGTGTLQLKINQSALLTDTAGMHLNTTTALLDDTTITVQTAFQSWADSNGLTGGNSLPTDNADGDTLTNLQEFAFGTNPTLSSVGAIIYEAGGNVTNPGSPIAQNVAPGGGVDYRAVFGRRKNYVTAGLSYTVQFSADMINWTTSTATPTVLTGPENPGDIEAVSVPYPFFIPVESGVKKPTFFRVGVANN